MARQPAVMNVIGQLSPDTVQFSAMRNNRILQAMQETGANQRTTMQEQGATARTAMQEQGAGNRAAMETGGANQRAQLAAKTQAAGQQADLQMRQKELAGSDARSAAEIRARRESDEFNANLQKEMKTRDQDFETARFEKWKAMAEGDIKRYEAWQAKEFENQDLDRMNNRADVMMNFAMLNSQIGKMTGAEQANEATITVRKNMAEKFRGRTQAFGAVDNQINHTLQDPKSSFAWGASVSGHVDKLFQDMTTQLQIPLTFDIFDPANRDKLEQAASTWDVSQSYAVVSTIKAIKDKLVTERDAAGKGGLLENALSKANRKGFLSSAAAEGKNIQRLENALSVLTSTLPASTRTLPDGPMTLGQKMYGHKLAHNGDTEGAIAEIGDKMYPENNAAFQADLLSGYRKPFDPGNPFWADFIQSYEKSTGRKLSPQTIAKFDAMRDMRFAMVPGVREGPQAGTPSALAGLMAPQDLTGSESRQAYINARYEESKRKRGVVKTIGGEQ